LSKFIFIVIASFVVTVGLASPALAQTSPIAPNDIVYVGDTDTIATGTAYNITVQILYNGGQLRSEGVRIYLLANDTSIIPAELGTYVLTDKDGFATYTVTANKAGDVKLTATAMSVNSGIAVDKTFHVTQASAATPTPTATDTPTPTPTPSVSVTPEPSVTVEPTATAAPTAGPTAEPTATATVAPTAVPETGDSNAQARGIIAVGIGLAIVLLAIVFLARYYGKK
jgi:hypothetical protein